MKSTRDKILTTLLTRQRMSTNDIAQEVGINAISVRHHLTSLQIELLVAAEEERHGVGRPRLVYFLTENGMEKFPTRFRLTTRLLTKIKDKLPEALINEMFKELATSLASEHEQEFSNLNLEERLDVMKDLLSDEGFVIEWEKQGAEYFIHEVNCPYLQIGQSHPEVCVVDETLISTMLALPTNKINCILNGANQCTYVVKNN